MKGRAEAGQQLCMSFAGLRVLTLESRRAKEMATLIARHEGVPFVAPSVEERPVEDDGTALRFVEQLEAGAFEMVICMTAVSLAFLRDVLDVQIAPGRLAKALSGTTVVSRGPKPIAVLRPLGVPVSVTIPEPNTWKEIVTAVAARAERRIAVLEYGRPNVEMNADLQRLGATVTPVALYRWELPSDAGPLREAVRRIAARECDVVLFTSSVQLDHLLEVARETGREEAVLRALARDTVIASVGPVMTATLEARGLSAHIVPQHPKMWALVKETAERAPEVLASLKREV